MQTLSLAIIVLAGAVIPSFFLYAVVYELRTGKSFALGGPSTPLSEKGPFAAAMVVLMVLSNLILVIAGIALFAEKNL
jgi:hypothetical protein